MENEKNYVNAVIILDMSGSMNPRRDDVIGGYNGLIEGLKEEEKVRITTILFNDGYHKLYNEIDPKMVDELTKEDYHPEGCTALLDAIGNTIEFLDSEYEDGKPLKTIMYITTDGMENSSTEYTYKMIEKMIKWHEKKEGWEIKFLASGINVEEEATRLGIDRNHAEEVDMTSSHGVLRMCSSIKNEVKEASEIFGKKRK